MTFYTSVFFRGLSFFSSTANESFLPFILLPDDRVDSGHSSEDDGSNSEAVEEQNVSGTVER